MRGASKVTLQHHQLRLPRKMNVINDLRDIWNFISNARRKWSHPPTSPNTAPATQYLSHQGSASHMKHHLQCAAQQESPSNFTKYCACHAKWMSSMICVTYETSFPMRGASKVTLQHHQLRLPRKMNVIDDRRHMKRHFQCAEQVKSPSNLTKYCPCHEILKLKIWAETPWSASANRKTIRGYPTISEHNPTISEHNPTIKSSSRTRRFGDLTRPSLETILYCKIRHFTLRLSPKMSRSPAPATKSPTRTSPQILRLPRKMNVLDDLRHIGNVISNARSQSSHPPTSPNTAPATKTWSSRFQRKLPECFRQ